MESIVWYWIRCAGESLSCLQVSLQEILGFFVQSGSHGAPVSRFSGAQVRSSIQCAGEPFSSAPMSPLPGKNEQGNFIKQDHVAHKFELIFKSKRPCLSQVFFHLDPFQDVSF